MQYLTALVLAGVQGLTEFIPISSSGHLALLQVMLNFQEPPIAFDLVLHIGTLVAVIVYYRADLTDMLRDAARPARWLRPNAPEATAGKMMSLIVVASIPTALIGFAVESRVEAAFSDLRSIGYEFIIGGVIMFLTLLRKHPARDLAGMRVVDAIVIGVLQGIAVFPAISRSGATISGALLLGLRPDLAGRFSFLLSIPAILGACLLEARYIAGQIHSAESLLIYGVSGAVAGIIGYLSIRPLIRMLQSAKFHYFAYYCVILGLAILFWTGVGV